MTQKICTQCKKTKIHGARVICSYCTETTDAERAERRRQQTAKRVKMRNEAIREKTALLKMMSPEDVLAMVNEE